MSGNWHDSFKNFIPIESLPIEYGGCRDVTVVSPNSSCFDITHNHLPLVELDDASMESVNISAGIFCYFFNIIHFKLKKF